MKFVIGSILILTALLPACGKDDAKQAGTKVGQTLTEFAAGVGKGMDEKLAVEAELTPDLVAQGLSKTVAKSTALNQPTTKPKAITVYLAATRPFKSTLLARALNAAGQEIGRATADVAFATNDAAYVTFQFPNELDTQLVQKYVIGSSPTSSAPVTSAPATSRT